MHYPNNPWQKRVEQLVDREVYCNVGPLVWESTLYRYGEFDDQFENFPLLRPNQELPDCSPEHWDTYCRLEAEKRHIEDEGLDLITFQRVMRKDPAFLEAFAVYVIEEEDDESALEDEDAAILEYWAVSGFLAELLLEKKEPVAAFGNLHIWGRVNSGQMVMLDSVIQQIGKELYELDQKYTVGGQDVPV